MRYSYRVSYHRRDKDPRAKEWVVIDPNDDPVVAVMLSNTARHLVELLNKGAQRGTYIAEERPARPNLPFDCYPYRVLTPVGRTLCSTGSHSDAIRLIHHLGPGNLAT